MSTVPGAQSQHGSSGRGCSYSPAEAAASAPRLGSARAGGRGSGMGCGSLASKGQGKSSVWGCPVHQGGAVPHLQCSWWAGALGGLGGTCELLAPRAAAMWQWGRLWARFPVPTVFQMDTLGMCLKCFAIAWLGSVQGKVTPEPPLQPLQGLGGQKPFLLPQLPLAVWAHEAQAALAPQRGFASPPGPVLPGSPAPGPLLMPIPPRSHPDRPPQALAHGAAPDPDDDGDGPPGALSHQAAPALRPGWGGGAALPELQGEPRQAE